MIFFKSIALLLFAVITGCASFGSGTVDSELGALMPKEAAFRLVNERLRLDGDLKLNASGFGSTSCRQLAKPGSVKDIRTAMFQTYTSGHRILWLSLEHPSNTMFCGSAVFVSGIAEDQVAPFLTALRSLGAPINKFQIVRHKLDCHGCGPVR
jgi:hypothetical protein